MRKLVWHMHMSLDGFVSGPGGELDWVGAGIDDELWEDIMELMSAADAALFGRVTYQMFEQNLTRYLTAFARFGWDNGKTESFAYTEVDQTFAQGVGANGAWWHRKQDRAGIAFISNAIKKDHQNYLAAGGQGFLLGDGNLNYGRENILETYYTAHVWRGIYLAPGLQHINNPGYNRDRGPVLVPTFRAHVEF